MRQPGTPLCRHLLGAGTERGVIVRWACRRPSSHVESLSTEDCAASEARLNRANSGIDPRVLALNHKSPAAILCRNLTRTISTWHGHGTGSTDDQIRARTAHFGSKSASLPTRCRARPKCYPGGNHQCHGPRRSSRASGVRHFRCQNSRRKDGPQSTYGHNRLRAEEGNAFL
jgi:hypothetical protein